MRSNLSPIIVWTTIKGNFRKKSFNFYGSFSCGQGEALIYCKWRPGPIFQKSLGHKLQSSGIQDTNTFHPPGNSQVGQKTQILLPQDTALWDTGHKYYTIRIQTSIGQKPYSTRIQSSGIQDTNIIPFGYSLFGYRTQKLLHQDTV